MTSGVATDLTENLIRDAALAAGLVDNKVCAIDDTWSGLRIVVPLRDRPPSSGSMKPGPVRSGSARPGRKPRKTR